MRTPDPTDHEDSTSDPARYISAEGYEPRPAKTTTRYKKEKERIAREWEVQFAPAMFEPRTANDAMRAVTKKDLAPAPLFLDLWHEHELAVLLGPPAAGKSILATQLAETLARGQVGSHAASEQTPPRVPSSDPRSKKVLLWDLENSDAQFARRYTCQDPWTGRRKRYKFAAGLNRPQLAGEEIPAVFKGDKARWLRNTFGKLVDKLEPEVIVIENLTSSTPPLALPSSSPGSATSAPSPTKPAYRSSSPTPSPNFPPRPPPNHSAFRDPHSAIWLQPTPPSPSSPPPGTPTTDM